MAVPSGPGRQSRPDAASFDYEADGSAMILVDGDVKKPGRHKRSRPTLARNPRAMATAFIA